jgi:hypothetical protein
MPGDMTKTELIITNRKLMQLLHDEKRENRRLKQLIERYVPRQLSLQLQSDK